MELVKTGKWRVRSQPGMETHVLRVLRISKSHSEEKKKLVWCWSATVEEGKTQTQNPEGMAVRKHGGRQRDSGREMYVQSQK